MTLEELLAEPHSEEALFDVNQRWLEAALVPTRVPFLEHLTLLEKKHLITHLVYNQQAWRALPPGSADAIFPVIADAAEPYNPLLRKLVCMSEETAGLETAKWMETALEGLIDFQRNESVHLRILWKVFGTRAIRLTARRWASLHKSESIWAEREFELLRQLAGISKRVWDLSMQLQPNPSAFERWMNDGVAISAREWRLLVEYSVHSQLLRGLVFWASDGTLLRAPDWPTDDNQSLAIAHPAVFVSESLRNHWKSGLQENAPFDQFRVAPVEALDFNPIGLRAAPADLFLHLEALGWIRGRADREGIIRNHTRAFPDLNITAELEYAPGVPTRFGGRWQQQTLRKLRFNPNDHPIACSTALAELASIGDSQ